MWFIAYIYIFLFSFVVSILVVPICKKLAYRFGFVAQSHPDKQRIQPTPLLGGLAIYFAFVFTVLVHYSFIMIFKNNEAILKIVPQAVIDYIPGIIKQTGRLFAFLFGGLFIFILGLVDDRWNLRPLTKILGQIAIAAFLVLFNIRITLFIPNIILTSIITILWVVTIINAFNFLDNMDGLAAGVAAIASLFFLFTAVQLNEYFISALLAILIGCLLGFLRYNFHPASIFMGDAGSMFIGYVLAVFTILGSYYSPESPTYFPVILPVVVLAIPLYEIVTVTLIRLKKNISPFKPSKDHFSFRLVDLGMTQRGAVLFIYLVTFCIGFAAVQLPKLNITGAILVLIQTITILTIVGLLEHFGKKGND